MPTDAKSPKNGYALCHPEAAAGSQTHDDRTETLVALAQRHSLHARFTEDWEKGPHGRSEIRVSRSLLPAVG
ncbi:hypothetical protein [Streptomyces sp. NPDC056660]|uniref:hypothetical protein n=1 Tax=Streptomyces sp. NPDC056660 TaxID=3345897 RepID=UPI0036D03BB2